MDDIRIRYAVPLLIALAVVPFLSALDNYYFYDDGRVLREAVRVDHEGAAVIFQDGFNGHFRPLPIASVWLTGRAFGFESPRPLHVLGIVLHAINILLIYSLLRGLFPDRNALAFFAAAVCAVQWAATESVTYISALGMLYSALGGLVASIAAVRWRSYADPRGSLIVVGVVVSLAGGEYGIAFAPMIFMCALWPELSGELHWRKAALIAAGLLPVYAVYIAWSLVARDHDRIGVVYSFGNHLLVQITDNLSYLFLPNKWIRKWPSLVLLATLLTASAVFSRSFRASLFSRKSALLIAAQLAALAPFSFSQLGNYYRFLYPAMAFSSMWLIWLADSLFERQAATARIGRRIVIGFGVFLIVANLINGIKRAREEGRRGHEVARFIEQLDRTIADHPQKSVTIHVDPDVESTIDTVVALGRLDRSRCLTAIPQWLAPKDVLLVGHYAWGRPFRFEILLGGVTADLDDATPRR